jgi:hypothetical protein
MFLLLWQFGINMSKKMERVTEKVLCEWQLGPMNRPTGMIAGANIVRVIKNSAATSKKPTKKPILA